MWNRTKTVTLAFYETLVFQKFYWINLDALFLDIKCALLEFKGTQSTYYLCQGIFHIFHCVKPVFVWLSCRNPVLLPECVSDLQDCSQQALPQPFFSQKLNVRITGEQFSVFNMDWMNTFMSRTGQHRQILSNHYFFCF